MMVLVTGGSGSGKSAYAEDRVLAFGDAPRIYIATMYPFDAESLKRVERHRKMRCGKGFETIECYTGLKNISLPAGSTVLLECMSNLVANEMFREDGAGEKAVEMIMEGICAAEEQSENLVIVTNEIFSETTGYEGDTERYREYLGRVNQMLAEEADEVVEVVYGIPVHVKQRIPG